MCSSLGVAGVLQAKSFFLGSILVALLAPWQKEERSCLRVEGGESTHSVRPTAESKEVFTKQSPLLFIGGVPKSGTTLMRVLLDVHPSIRCGPETHVIIDVLKLRYEWANFGHLHKRNEAAGVTNSIIDSAVAAFILEVVARHGDPADVICAKEPFLMTQAGFLATAFNNSKVIHMVRDGRAISHSLVSRGLEFPPFSPTNHTQNLRSWANLATGMDRICRAIGPNRCRTVKYEQLVQEPERTLKDLLSWLDLPWEPKVLNHQEVIGEVATSSMETTADQIVRPVYREAIERWRGEIPDEVLRDNLAWAPALRTFGYTLFQ